MGPASISGEGRMAGRRATAAVVAAFTMMAADRASAHDEPIARTDQDDATIVLHVVNYAALPGDILHGAKGRVEMVYERIGVRIWWVDSDRAVNKHRDGGLHLTVTLLSRDMVQKKTLAEGISDGALGQAHFASGRAHIFCDRTAAMPGANPLAIQLGTVIAHEVGHLLLGENSHSRSGVMRADIDAHAIHLQSFTKAQARAIHAALTEPNP